MNYEHIQQALDKVQATLSKKELKELLQENQSYLCSEFRPEFSNEFEVALITLNDEDTIAILDTVDNFWICILNQCVKNNGATPMSQILTPQEVLRAIADGKKLDYKWYTNTAWSRFDPLDTNVYVDNVMRGKYIFRLAQEMITIGDVSFPKPESIAPKDGTKYWVVEPSNKCYTTLSTNRWRDDELDMRYLKRGLVHLSRANAIAHAKALIKLSE